MGTWSWIFCEIIPILPRPGLTFQSMTGKQRYSLPTKCNKDVDQRTWILHPSVSYCISATYQPARQSSWPAIPSIYRSNPSAIIIRTITNKLIKRHCNDQQHHHQHLIKNPVAIIIINIITFLIASPQTLPSAPPWSPHTSTSSSSSSSSLTSLLSKPPPSLPILSSSFILFSCFYTLTFKCKKTNCA
jgi:hypothetical protein